MHTVAEMRQIVFIDGPDGAAKHSRFWILLALSSVIAAAGVVGDSTATVIGAMIVAPLMTPILGVVLATVIGDRRNLLVSAGLVLGGAAAAILIGWLIGFFDPLPVVAANNSQVAARVSPKIIDLVGALATGAVGAIALVRKDISDTLPGVAIAISLVPPLSVVGLTLESGALHEAGGALLLFAANVAAILATGVIVLLGFRIGSAPHAERADGVSMWGARRRSVVTVLITLVIIGIPLGGTSIRVTQQALEIDDVRSAVQPWADDLGLDVVGITADGDQVVVSLEGEPPEPSTAELAPRLEAAGVDPADVVIEYSPAYRIELGG
ncbi:DUF389 domain-containing protein [Agromyces sp. MMS17-SY077]|uniref:DUF389 domain-containing protein n=2 Tax=Agromyces seonyuensis TaxID=2662446 RepID=A0A6I4NYV9_9MICO|nr:DUF389 domain-containing protein [Agromyces seonyuensis]